jgi:putative transposase
MSDIDFQFFRPREPIDITQRNLPHWEQRDAYYFITYRTADSIPESVAKAWRLERDTWLTTHGIDPQADDVQHHIELLPDDQHHEFYRTFTTQWHDHLDAGHGECQLRQQATRDIVTQSLQRFDGERYRLESYIIMPNHVHVLAGVTGRGEMRKQCRNWKKFTATEINKTLGREGQFWQWESYDHLVRSPESLARFRAYIARNPIKAKLRADEYTLYLRGEAS